MPKKKTLGERIVELMDAKGINQSTLARKSGVDRSQLNRCIKHGARLQPYQIVAIAKVLDVSPDELGAEVPNEARHILEEFDCALARAASAEAERDRLRASLEEAEAQMVAAKQEATTAAEKCVARVAEARVRADATHRAILDGERARAADELRAAVEDERSRNSARVAELEGEVLRLRRHVNALTRDLDRVEGEKRKWMAHTGALHQQLEKKKGDVIGVGVLAALGGLMLADNKPRRRR